MSRASAVDFGSVPEAPKAEEMVLASSVSVAIGLDTRVDCAMLHKDHFKRCVIRRASEPASDGRATIYVQTYSLAFSPCTHLRALRIFC